MKIKRIDGYRNYVVTDCGRIFNTDTGRELGQWKNNHGYLLAHLSKHNIKRAFQVHRLVAIAFIRQPEGLDQVNHKDGIKTNNHVDNLEWTNNSGNQLHAYAAELHIPLKGVQKPNAKCTEEQVHMICEFLQAGASVPGISESVGVSRDIIHRIKDGSNWKHISSLYSIKL
jgi:hypothetical protein